MKKSDFNYILPEELIARYPAQKRSASRMLLLDGAVEHKQFIDLLDLLTPNDLLVFNNSKVIPARVFGEKETGGKVEILVERILPSNQALAHVKASKSPKVGSRIFLKENPSVAARHLPLERGGELAIVAREDDLFVLQFNRDVLNVLNEIGHMPLPHYMQRDDEIGDLERYQTVYAKHDGSVAAPTAGLHFDEELLEKIKVKGVETAFVTLHVGAGTFQPVRAENIEDHKMHAEWVEVSGEVVAKVKRAKEVGGRVIAVGTTSVRCLETANQKSYSGETDIFIYPGYKFNTVDAMLTNFHLPESSLIMLVSAFVGRDKIMAAYQAAIDDEYRFYSYGDCMFLVR